MSGGLSGHGMSMTMSIGPYLLAWLAMMAAMMLPAVSPVVRIYARAAAVGRVAPAAFFVTGYLLVWTAVGVPAYFAWRWLAMPVMDGDVWAARTAGGLLLVAGSYQLSPIKQACLRHCRSPMGFFLRLRGNLMRPSQGLRAGSLHALYCLGCCWGLMVILVTAGAMVPWWAIGIAAVVFIEKNAPKGELFAGVLAAILAIFGASLLIHPDLIMHVV
jgi:predicted metal-binding membrane protein